jgi:hypothetical protein
LLALREGGVKKIGTGGAGLGTREQEDARALCPPLLYKSKERVELGVVYADGAYNPREEERVNRKLRELCARASTSTSASTSAREDETGGDAA